MLELIVALDIGTTAAKATLVDRNGRAHGSRSAAYALHSAPGGMVEQEAEEWWRATRSILRDLLVGAPGSVVAIALTGQMQDCILLGESGVLRRAILYSDTRAGAEAAEVTQRIGADTLLATTGNLQDASSLPAKLLWIERHEPEVARRTETILLGAHDYVCWRLCGQRVTDHTTASTTGLLDIGANRWAADLLAALGLRTDWLPRLVRATDAAGEVTAAAAAETGLPAGVPVFHGAGDVATNTVGVGAGESGGQYMYLGTSGWLARSSSSRSEQTPEGVFTLRHAVPEWFILVGPMLTAGGNLEWLREQWGALEAPGRPDEEYAVLLARAGEAPPGCEGLRYLPYLAGERAPFRDPDARGGWIGLSRGTSRGTMYRAVLEGVAFGFRSIQATMAVPGEDESSPVPLAGGGGRSELWCQILADVLNRPIVIPAAPEDVAARGAAILAGRGLGWYASFAPGMDFFPTAARYDPDPVAARLYDRAYEHWAGLYPALRYVLGAR